MMAREASTDERLDDLNAKVDRGFDRVDARLDRMEARFDRADEKFERMEERFDERFEAMHRLLLQLGGVIVAGLLGVIATQL